ncbi:transcription cofactor HES-6-like isoform X3 [Erythrolamprus reginae]|uniref:transcription cofactor HES-6-like isoform X3 n=1 Tax=Erythrolamprus reginae TaxID=121349 RepID=UPI00396CA6EE
MPSSNPRGSESTGASECQRFRSLPPKFGELRKPLIERKRRERINNCLDELKETVVAAFRLDSKLEKADILEMTVKHLQNIQHKRNIADSKMGLEAQQKYSTGYIQCMHEVHSLLLTCDWMDKTLGARLLNHLLKSLPKSNEETYKENPNPSTPLNGKGNTTGSSQSQHQRYPTEVKLGLKKSFQPQLSSQCNQHELPHPREILQPHFEPNGVNLGSLNMWRPW